MAGSVFDWKYLVEILIGCNVLLAIVAVSAFYIASQNTARIHDLLELNQNHSHSIQTLALAIQIVNGVLARMPDCSGDVTTGED